MKRDEYSLCKGNSKFPTLLLLDFSGFSEVILSKKIKSFAFDQSKGSVPDN